MIGTIGGSPPVLIKPSRAGERLAAWAQEHRSAIEAHLLREGAVLLRGFSVNSATDFEEALRGTFGRLLEYRFRSTPRTLVSGNIYTSTEYPAGQTIPLHNENSYAASWPQRVSFYCEKAAPQGGETPLADSRKVFARIDPRIRARFAEKRVLYARNYGGGVDLSWQEVFQTESRAAVEESCRSAGIGFEWKGERLRTRQVCQAVATHPTTGESVWFNQAHLFHVSSLPARSREALQAMFPEDEFPRNAYYGDGSPLELTVLDEIRAAYDAEAVTFSWQEGDVLMLDNLLIAHGRKPFRGPRRVLVGMA